MNEFLNTPTFHWVVLPLLVFCARICDVTLGTMRHLLLSRGHKILVPILGFIEVMIWLVTVKQVLGNLDNWITYVAFAGGFATGNYVGMVLEEKLAVGLEVIRIFTKSHVHDMCADLKKAGYGYTLVDAQGSTGKVNLIFTIVDRTEHDKIIQIIHKHDPKAFYSVEDVKQVSRGGVFPQSRRFQTTLNEKDF
jgi:uncharacterized protein YebE (UPF0316 family)